VSTRAFRNRATDANTYLPRLIGTRGAAATHHYLSAQVAKDILTGGGNAVDAAVAATFVEGVVNPQMYTLGGECPMLIHMADRGDVVCINGNTAAPGLATPKAYRERGYSDVPAEGVLAAGVPAAFGALLTALANFGRLTFSEVIAPAVALAREGFPVHRGLVAQERFGVRDLVAKFRSDWPSSSDLYLSAGNVPREGTLLQNPALASTLDALVELERANSDDRRVALQAVVDGFYRGDVAAEIDRYSRDHGGLLRRSDIERFETRLEEPASIEFHTATIFKCGAWNQGPALLQAIAILERFDLRAMGHNSSDYLHTVIEALNLAFADRDQYYGDPEQIDVPLAELLSKTYAKQRAELIGERACPDLRPGDPVRGRALLAPEARFTGSAWGPGTVHVDVIDAEGNMVACTPSGGWIKSSEVIPLLGFPLTNRLMTFYLAPAHHPNIVAPFRRPRTTISPSLAFHRGRPWMVFGSMGGDQQDQWMVQFLLNRVIFDMSIQEAIEAPKFSSEHFPGFFAPHDSIANRVRIEPRVEESVRAELVRRGHDLELAADWTEGYLLAACRDPQTGVLEAGCDLRGWKAEIFPAFALAW